jgi:hypothetical protein
MTATNKLGIWMDHAAANIIEYPNDSTGIKTIESDFTHEEKELTLSKSERMMHNKEQHEQKDYYKKLCAIMINYNYVILFGTTDAKVELYNYLRKDNRFTNIKVEIEKTDKKTENQQRAFVKEYFESRM